jgi:hypothetical protein
VGNEENGSTVPNSNKIMINIINEPGETYKKSLKEEIMEKITEKLIKS